jgi:hypothetical protein
MGEDEVVPPARMRLGVTGALLTPPPSTDDMGEGASITWGVEEALAAAREARVGRLLPARGAAAAEEDDEWNAVVSAVCTRRRALAAAAAMD